MASNYLAYQNQTTSLSLALNPKIVNGCLVVGVVTIGSGLLMLAYAAAKRIVNSDGITFKYNGASIEVEVK